MKHLITLVSVLVVMSATVYGDDIKRNKKRANQTVAVAPFVWGDPDADAPAELLSPMVAKIQFPVAPFIWGDSDEVLQITELLEIKTSAVAIAPFILGDPNEEIIIHL